MKKMKGIRILTAWLLAVMMVMPSVAVLGENDEGEQTLGFPGQPVYIEYNDNEDHELKINAKTNAAGNVDIQSSQNGKESTVIVYGNINGHADIVSMGNDNEITLQAKGDIGDYIYASVYSGNGTVTVSTLKDDGTYGDVTQTKNDIVTAVDVGGGSGGTVKVDTGDVTAVSETQGASGINAFTNNELTNESSRPWSIFISPQ